MTAKEMLKQRICESWHGRFFEDFEVGDVYLHPLGRTITTTDNIWFTLLTQNTAPVHFDHHYAAQTEFGRPLVNSCLVLSLVTGQSVTDLSQNVMANLAWDQVRLPHPVFEGDTIYSRSQVMATRPSKSRSNVGIVTAQTTGVNHDDVVVITFHRTLLVYRRGQGPSVSRSAGGDRPLVAPEAANPTARGRGVTKATRTQSSTAGTQPRQ
jgi:itaconyl-CoA hydratase